MLLLGVSICFSSTRHEPYPPMQMGLGVIQNMSPAGDLTKNLFVWQNFASPYDVLSGVVLFMATYVRPILSTLTIRLT